MFENNPAYIRRKSALRRHWHAIRDSIPAKTRHRKSRRIADLVLTHPALAGDGAVFAYLSFRSEPETHTLIRTLLARGVQTAVPLCDPSSGTMRAAALTRWDQLRPGHYGILEPDPQLVKSGEIKELPKSRIGLVLVPGLAFDQDGFRLGYGGGYYDRYLADYAGISIGLAFAECLTPELPRESFDKPVSLVLTDHTEIKWEG